MARVPDTIKVRVEVEQGWPSGDFYCPCAMTCHRDRSPCSFGCVAHDYLALHRIVRPNATHERTEP